MFIVERNNPLILTKLTDTGRKSIAQGNFDVKYFSIGDSEVNYNQVDEVNLKILKTADRQPLTKFFIQKDFNCKSLIEIEPEQINIVNGIVKNKAKKRGFFTSNFIGATNLNDTYFKLAKTIKLSALNGTDTLNISGVFTNEEFNLLNDGDIILFKIDINESEEHEVSSPIPYLFFGVEKNGVLPELIMDRNLPKYDGFANANSIDIEFYVLPRKEDIISYYSSSGRTITWNPETLDFNEDCDTDDTNVWNLNIPYCNDYIGTSGCTDSYKDYMSQEYAGALTYFDICKDCYNLELEASKCQEKLLSVKYLNKKSVGVIHFSNYNTRNEYGEFLFIDNTNEETKLKVVMPSVMWHRSSSGDTIGMVFTSHGNLKYLDADRANLSYYDVVDDTNYIRPELTNKVVGKVFPDLKVVLIEDQELLNALSYKSNRNWTLPDLKGSMISPIEGIGTGILAGNKRLYMTYMLKSNDAVMYSFPLGNIIYFDNDTVQDRDIEFTLEDTGMLPYMRQKQDVGYDNTGFYADKFIVLYQITDINQKPDNALWSMVDFTNNVLRGGVSTNSINPANLENQNSYVNSFRLTNNRVASNFIGNYSNAEHCLGCSMDIIDLGAEQIFFGNIDTHIGASLYRLILNLKVDNTFQKNENLSYISGDYYISEIGLYNSLKELVGISKLSRPIKLRTNTVTEIEISLDF